MDKRDFDKLCDETYKKCSDEIKSKVSDFPDDIEVTKGDEVSDEQLFRRMNKPSPL